MEDMRVARPAAADSTAVTFRHQDIVIIRP